jgi:arylsulfatase A-like enzyme
VQLARVSLGASLPGALIPALAVPFLLTSDYYTVPEGVSLSRALLTGLGLSAATALFMAAGGLGLTLLTAGLGAMLRRPVDSRTRLAFVLVGPQMILLIAAAGLYANLFLLRYRFSPISLATDAAIVLVGFSLLIGASFALRQSVGKVAARLASPPVTIAGSILLAVGLVAWLSSSEPTGGSIAAAPSFSSSDASDGSVNPRLQEKIVAKGWNLLIVSVDTLRADHLGVYGYSRPTSPNIDRFAASAIRVQNAYSHSPWTLPSHVTMMLGQYPSVHGADLSPAFAPGADRLAEERVTLAEILSGFGYATAAFTSTPLLGVPYGFHQGFQVFDSDSGRRRKHQRDEGLAGRWDKARAWLDTVQREPYFLFVHCYDVHDYAPPAEERARFVRPYTGPLRDLDIHTLQRQVMSDGFYSLDPDDVRYLRDLYDATIAQVDRAMGRILRYLDERSDGDRTIVVITSDHGEEFYEHGGTGHGFTFFEEQLRVPLLIRLPGGPSGLVVHSRLGLVDLLPTLLELLDLPIPEDVQGESMLSSLWGAPSADRTVFAEASHVGNGAALISGNSKLIRENYFPPNLLSLPFLLYNLRQLLTPRPDRLFDLGRDPTESRAITEQERERTVRMSQQLEAIRRANGARRNGPSRGTAPMDAETRERLRAIGYIE